MDVLFIGQNASGKSSNMKKYLELIDGNIIVLDFSNQFDEFSDNVLFLDDINPLLDEISISDIIALNAGYLPSSRCLYKKALEVIEESFINDDTKGNISLEDYKNKFLRAGLIEESIERLHISWDKIDSSYGKILNKKIPLRKQDKHISVESAINFINSHDRVVLKSKNMHSDQLRAISFILLSRLSHQSHAKFSIVGDEISLFFNNGNINMFKDAINREALDFIVSFNKCSNIPKSFFPNFDVYYIHRFENNSELKELKRMGLSWKMDIKKLPIGKFIKLKPISKEDKVNA